MKTEVGAFAYLVAKVEAVFYLRIEDSDKKDKWKGAQKIYIHEISRHYRMMKSDVGGEYALCSKRKKD